ncbi:hypothetical protein JLT2_11 [Paraglaciecola Antarctic JLT virus 2]|nr:hypothetical protein JLT2_11 [Paraglaciecola Antarctic JLT virus 2]
MVDVMNIKDLKELIKDLPDDMELLTDRMSDYDTIEADEWGIIKAVPQGQYVMKSHPTMSEENKAKEKEYFHLEGN